MKCLLLVSLAVVGAASLSAQTGSVLNGRVMDVGQSPLPGVKVTVSGTVERTAITDGSARGIQNRRAAVRHLQRQSRTRRLRDRDRDG